MGPVNQIPAVSAANISIALSSKLQLTLESIITSFGRSSCPQSAYLLLCPQLATWDKGQGMTVSHDFAIVNDQNIDSNSLSFVCLFVFVFWCSDLQKPFLIHSCQLSDEQIESRFYQLQCGKRAKCGILMSEANTQTGPNVLLHLNLNHWRRSWIPFCLGLYVLWKEVSS